MKPWGTNSLLDTMVSLSQSGNRGWDLYKYTAEENSSTQGKASDVQWEGPEFDW